MTPPWDLVFHQAALRFLENQRGNRRRALRMQLEKLADAPYAEPDAYCRGAHGRQHLVRYAGSFAIVYWLDVFVREVRVVEIHPR
jgi:hypothetical protein